jgi:hypothetical protein
MYVMLAFKGIISVVELAIILIPQLIAFKQKQDLLLYALSAGMVIF